MQRFLLVASLAVLFAPISDAADWIELAEEDTLDGWTKVGGEATYEIEDGVITGKTGPGKNTFLTKGPYSDFILEYEVKCDPELNSGVQIRSHLYSEPTPQESKPERLRDEGEMYGYQCEITASASSHGCAGNFWDEGRRTRWLDTSIDGSEKQKAYRPGEWNQFRVIAQGNRIRSFINGVAIADFTDDRDAEGLIGLQVHSIPKNRGPYQVSWKNLRLKKITADENVE